MPILRRTFIKQSGVLAAGLMATPLLGSSATTDRTGKILQKKLDKAWINSLYQRTKPTTYLKSRNELQYIGMPAGGIGCGMVYLGGDGRLWLWDVFNKNQTGVVYKNVPWHEPIQFNFPFLRPFDGANYVEPVKDVRPLDQGFAIRIQYNGRSITKRLEESEWDEITFEATYPTAAITYVDKSLPVTITLHVGSPFIPLNEDDSGLPATVFSFTIVNHSSEAIQVDLAGWLENKSSLYTADNEEYFHVNEGSDQDGVAAAFQSSESYNWVDEAFWGAPDYGNFCIASFNKDTAVNVIANVKDDASLFETRETKRSKIKISDKAISSVSNHLNLKAGESAELNYCIAWYFPNLSFEKMKSEGGRYYSKKFKSSLDVTQYIGKNFEKLNGESKLWMDTWYKESTLPHWFLERTFLNISTLSTTTVHRFASGRFYGWEGVGSCPGTCNHVWQYAQAVGRIFPALERDTRERVDLGIALHDDGHIGFRAEYDTQPALDGQAGRILDIYREHQMSTDDEFLHRVWPKTKQALIFLMQQDTNGDGMTDTQLENTLDAKWPGEIAWIVGLSICAIKAGTAMAAEMNDQAFAEQCQKYVFNGMANMEKHLYNGEYFIHKPDAIKGRTVIGSYNTCHIDQVYGQSWAHQVGLGRTISKEKTVSALRALWNYNFTTDVGPYIKEHRNGRPYALAGEGGMIMNTNPYNEADPYGVKDAWQVTYFHECMSGFEHQVASHMMAEGMVEESLILTRSIHDRYDAAKRNPFNEVECSDHYARAMASYGTFITACGFTYHGPKGIIGFAPKLTPENFKAPFTAAASWGTYQQTKKGKRQYHEITVKYGSLILNQIELEKPGGAIISQVKMDSATLSNKTTKNGSKVVIKLETPTTINAGQSLIIEC